LIYKCFGVSETTTTVLSVVGTALSAPLGPVMGNVLFGLRAGLISTLLFATCPLALRFGSILVPEPIAGFEVLLAVWFYLRAEVSHTFRRALAAGVLLGISFETKESYLLPGLALGLMALWIRRWIVAVGLVAGVVIPVMAREHLLLEAAKAHHVPPLRKRT
jgi:4-amino-4-deoxy-L-arabinose transferase-like glycosyltransferase